VFENTYETNLFSASLIECHTSFFSGEGRGDSSSSRTEKHHGFPEFQIVLLVPYQQGGAQRGGTLG